jgi:plastocyanin
VTRAPAAVVLVAAALVAATVGAGPATAAGHHGKLREVGVHSDYFDPAKLTIHVGDRIRWVWDGGTARHSVFVDRGPSDFHSPTQSSGTYTHRFTRAGVYHLQCSQHMMMRMTVTVKRA